MIWWLLSRLAAVIMIAAGIFLTVFFPNVPQHQEAQGKGSRTSFGLAGIVIGLVLIIAGGFLLFSP